MGTRKRSTTDTIIEYVPSYDDCADDGQTATGGDYAAHERLQQIRCGLNKTPGKVAEEVGVSREALEHRMAAGSVQHTCPSMGVRCAACGLYL